MKENISRQDILNAAGLAGLVLGAISSAYIFCTHFIGGIHSLALNYIVSITLWSAKFAACIILMRFFMKKLVARHEGVTNADTLKFGLLTAFCSALIFSAASMAYYLWVNPTALADAVQAFNEGALAAGSGFDSNTMERLDRISGKLPQIAFFCNLVYCFLFGTVLSLILSKNIPSKDPFAEFQPKKEE